MGATAFASILGRGHGEHPQYDDVDGDITVALACTCGEASGVLIFIALNAAETKHMCAWMHGLGAWCMCAWCIVHGAWCMSACIVRACMRRVHGASELGPLALCSCFALSSFFCLWNFSTVAKLVYSCSSNYSPALCQLAGNQSVTCSTMPACWQSCASLLATAWVI